MEPNRETRRSDGVRLSAIVPTLDSAPTLGRTLAALRDGADEILVVDAGSTDAGPAIAARFGARLITAPRGRGVQLAAGARTARGAWLLFVHADTVLGAAWGDAAARFMAEPGNADRAAAFRYAVDLDGRAARRLERYVAWRSRHGLPYGDQALLIARDFYRALGGFAELPIMEDVDLIRRIGRLRLVILDVPALTAGTRYRRAGIALRGARNLACLALYYLGVSPRLIAKLYG